MKCWSCRKELNTKHNRSIVRRRGFTLSSWFFCYGCGHHVCLSCSLDYDHEGDGAGHSRKKRSKRK